MRRIFLILLPFLLFFYFEQNMGQNVCSVLGEERNKIITIGNLKGKIVLDLCFLFTFTISCVLLLSICSSNFRSLYSKVWITCSVCIPVRSENSGRSSNATRDSQLIKTRGISWAIDKFFWIKVNILLRKRFTSVQAPSPSQKYCSRCFEKLTFFCQNRTVNSL